MSITSATLTSQQADAIVYILATTISLLSFADLIIVRLTHIVEGPGYAESVLR